MRACACALTLSQGPRHAFVGDTVRVEQLRQLRLGDGRLASAACAAVHATDARAIGGVDEEHELRSDGEEEAGEEGGLTRALEEHQRVGGTRRSALRDACTTRARRKRMGMRGGQRHAWGGGGAMGGLVGGVVGIGKWEAHGWVWRGTHHECVERRRGRAGGNGGVGVCGGTVSLRGRRRCAAHGGHGQVHQAKLGGQSLGARGFARARRATHENDTANALELPWDTQRRARASEARHAWGGRAAAASVHASPGGERTGARSTAISRRMAPREFASACCSEMSACTLKAVASSANWARARRSVGGRGKGADASRGARRGRAPPIARNAARGAHGARRVRRARPAHLQAEAALRLGGLGVQRVLEGGAPKRLFGAERTHVRLVPLGLVGELRAQRGDLRLEGGANGAR
jgi:hypothetical protein